MVAIVSPCQRICVLDPEGFYCLGCARSRDEIRQWIRYSDSERQVIMDSLEERMHNIETERKERARARRAERGRQRAGEPRGGKG